MKTATLQDIHNFLESVIELAMALSAGIGTDCLTKVVGSARQLQLQLENEWKADPDKWTDD